MSVLYFLGIAGLVIARPEMRLCHLKCPGCDKILYARNSWLPNGAALNSVMDSFSCKRRVEEDHGLKYLSQWVTDILIG